jgi:hypothetical protein
MAINPIRSAAISSLTVSPDQQRADRSRDHASTGRPNAEAMRVELSPVARIAAASSAVTTSNRSAAASADFLASPEGSRMLSSLSPSNPKAAVRL